MRAPKKYRVPFMLERKAWRSVLHPRSWALPFMRASKPMLFGPRTPLARFETRPSGTWRHGIILRNPDAVALAIRCIALAGTPVAPT